VLAKFEFWLKVTGLAALLAGVVVGYLDFSGRFLDPDKQAFLEWILTTPAGLALSEPAAQKFMRDFPPPADSRPAQITHVTKNVLRFEKGPVQSASLNYMHADGSRTGFVATLEDVRAWAEQTPYPWIVWILSFVGFLEVFLGFLIERYAPK
jgi:hypothetical protein